LRRQEEVIDGWLTERFETVLPMVMSREGFDMWIVICREANEDPVFLTLAAASQVSAKRLSIFVFFRTGESTVERYMIMKTRTDVGSGLYVSYWKSGLETPWENLRAFVEEKAPGRIGINVSGVSAFGDGLSHSLYVKLMHALGENYAIRCQSADKLAVAWLETRTENECAAYDGIVQIAHGVISEAFSSRVITPGVTTGKDVSWWIRQRFCDLGISCGFAVIGIQRRGAPVPPHNEMILMAGQLPPETVIMPGDVLHCDVGSTYLRFHTDTVHNAYILRRDETDAPAGIKEAMASANRLQDIVTGEMKQGRSGNEILARSRARAAEERIQACIYNHPIGLHPHGAGPLVGRFDQQGPLDGVGEYILHDSTIHALELSVRHPVPEWDGQQIFIALEQDVLVKDGAVWYFDARQERFHLVR
jgi:hypothetical protein